MHTKPETPSQHRWELTQKEADRMMDCFNALQGCNPAALGRLIATVREAIDPGRCTQATNGNLRHALDLFEHLPE